MIALSDSRKRTRDENLEIAWSRGDLRYLLRPYQLEMRDKARACKGRSFFALCSRRIGKTHTLSIVDTLEDSIRFPGFDTKIAFSTLGQAEKVVDEVMGPVIAQCPQHLRPKYNGKHLVYEFKNGSTIWLAGADTRRNADRLRGLKAKKVKLDEACHMPEFEYLVGSVLAPQLLTTGGVMWYLSTPPDSPAHPSVYKYRQCAARGDSIVFDVWVAREWYGTDTINEFIAEEGGPKATKVRREYFAHIVGEESMLVVPEFQNMKDDLVIELPIPEFRHYWVAADFGFSDMTVVVFGYLDFQRARIVVEDELAFQGVSGIEVGNAIKAKELAIWGADARPTRIADAPAQLLADLASVCGVAFGPARKDDADAALNALRMDCHRKILAVHPRCKVTISHLENAIWNTSRTSFARSEGLGHFDGVDAVKYLCRHIDRHANPFPPLYGIDPSRQNIPERLLAEHRARSLAGAFGR